MNTWPQRGKSAEVRFLEKVNKLGPRHPYEPSRGRCWIWTGAKAKKIGYGYIWDKRNIACHRFAFEHWRGPIPPGMHCLHTCDNPACVNPWHLYVGTQSDNMHDKVVNGRSYAGDEHWARQHPERVKRGERHFNSKLTADKVVEIRTMYSNGLTQAAIARLFGVTIQEIHCVVRRKLWKHI